MHPTQLRTALQTLEEHGMNLDNLRVCFYVWADPTNPGHRKDADVVKHLEPANEFLEQMTARVDMLYGKMKPTR